LAFHDSIHIWVVASMDCPNAPMSTRSCRKLPQSPGRAAPARRLGVKVPLVIVPVPILVLVVVLRGRGQHTPAVYVNAIYWTMGGMRWRLARKPRE
jgi:hypothetical protein